MGVKREKRGNHLFEGPGPWACQHSKFCIPPTCKPQTPRPPPSLGRQYTAVQYSLVWFGLEQDPGTLDKEIRAPSPRDRNDVVSRRLALADFPAHVATVIGVKLYAAAHRYLARLQYGLTNTPGLCSLCRECALAQATAV